MYLGEAEPGNEAGVTGKPTFLQSITDLAKTIVPVFGQIRLQDLNMELIRQGKPTLNAAQMSALAPQLNVGIAPDTQKAIGFLGLGLGALFLVMLATRKRAR